MTNNKSLVDYGDGVHHADGFEDRIFLTLISLMFIFG